jgi:hypothetical protein
MLPSVGYTPYLSSVSHINAVYLNTLIMKATVGSVTIRNVRLNGHTVRISEPKASISEQEFFREIKPILRKLR